MSRMWIAGLCLLSAAGTQAGTTLGIESTRFTLNGKPTFLLGISYYGALSAPDGILEKDLARMKELGFNWIRVWAAWQAFDVSVSAVDADGRGREPYLSRLKALVERCDRLGLVVDVTVTRGTALYNEKLAYIQTLDAHRRAVETLVDALRPYRNWYMDLGNERNINDRRHVSFEDLKILRDLVKKLDPERLVTASNAGDIRDEHLREYVLAVQVDFIAPHRPRNDKSPGQTEERTRQYLARMGDLGRVVPVHYQEPLRRGFGRWEPQAEDFVIDARGAERGGAAGWCFHNGDERDQPGSHPRRSFDLREKTLFEQLDEAERQVVAQLGPILASAPAPPGRK